MTAVLWWAGVTIATGDNGAWYVYTDNVRAPGCPSEGYDDPDDATELRDTILYSRATAHLRTVCRSIRAGADWIDGCWILRGDGLSVGSRVLVHDGNYNPRWMIWEVTATPEDGNREERLMFESEDPCEMGRELAAHYGR